MKKEDIYNKIRLEVINDTPIIDLKNILERAVIEENYTKEPTIKKLGIIRIVPRLLLAMSFVIIATFSIILLTNFGATKSMNDNHQPQSPNVENNEDLYDDLAIAAFSFEIILNEYRKSPSTGNSNPEEVIIKDSLPYLNAIRFLFDSDHTKLTYYKSKIEVTNSNLNLGMNVEFDNNKPNKNQYYLTTENYHINAIKNENESLELSYYDLKFQYKLKYNVNELEFTKWDNNKVIEIVKIRIVDDKNISMDINFKNFDLKYDKTTSDIIIDNKTIYTKDEQIIPKQ